MIESETHRLCDLLDQLIPHSNIGVTYHANAPRHVSYDGLVQYEHSARADMVVRIETPFHVEGYLPKIICDCIRSKKAEYNNPITPGTRICYELSISSFYLDKVISALEDQLLNKAVDNIVLSK